MRVSIFGCGYVGLVTGACLADVGNDVVCCDVDENRVEMLNRGETPIYEPGLEAMLKANKESGRLQFTTDGATATRHGQLLFVCVGTPAREDGSADLRHVLAVARLVGENLKEYAAVVSKSTVPVGTADQVREEVLKGLKARGSRVEFGVASNPEFLKEGDAINDFMKPDRIIFGTSDERVAALLRELYAPFNRNHDRVQEMDIRSAELTKYAANAMLATRISFMNELANIAERVGADIEQVRVGIGSDTRIGYSFIYPGCGYGGSCFPKDVRALAQTARQTNYNPRILDAVDAANEVQKKVLLEKIMTHFEGDVSGRAFGVWGLSFKPGTDDMREASSKILIDGLLDAGAEVRAYDPRAMDVAREIYEGRERVVFCEDALEAVREADGLVIVTEWKEFRSPNFCDLKQALRQPVIFDGRNLFSPEALRSEGFAYYSIGRPVYS